MSPSYRAFDVTVAALERLSPSFIRVTFIGDDLHKFGGEGLDQRFKILLPNALGGYPPTDFSDDGWYGEWSALSEAERPPMRTYTVRALSTNDGEIVLDVDFVAHGEGVGGGGSGGADFGGAGSGGSGPASRWVNAAQLGDLVKIIGPDADSGGPWGGVAWNPPAEASLYILAGDETAAPAIAAVLESLPADARAHAFIEVPTARDALALSTPRGVTVTWLAREHRAHGELLCAAVLRAIPGAGAPGAEVAEGNGLAVDGAAIDAYAADTDDDIWELPGINPLTGEPVITPTAETYAWLAGEAGVIKKLRRHLVQGAGIHKSQIAFMGYWRSGAAQL